jgi:hypothetical protein
MKCPKCNNDNPDGAKFWRTCVLNVVLSYHQKPSFAWNVALKLPEQFQIP